MGFLQGAAGCHILSASMYNYLAGMRAADIKVDVAEVPDPDVQHLLSQVCTATKNPVYKTSDPLPGCTDS